MGLGFDPRAAVLNFIVLALSLTVHEFSHAFAAWKLGDDTAARAGRLTLNPIPHLDLVGSVILPLLGMPIGWAKPVPVEPRNFTRRFTMGTGDIIVSSAGPLSNLAFGAVCAIVLGLLARFAPQAVAPGGGVREILLMLMITNAGLAIFNLLPIPPLDGGHVAEHLMPRRYQHAWETFARYSPFILLAVLVISMQTGFLSPPIRAVTEIFSRIAAGVAS